MDNEQGNVNVRPETPPVRESYILIKFAEPNSTLLEIQYENVSPLQVRCASWILGRDAEHTLDDALETRKQQQARQQQAPKLVVPQGYGGIVPK